MNEVGCDAKDCASLLRKRDWTNDFGSDEAPNLSRSSRSESSSSSSSWESWSGSASLGFLWRPDLEMAVLDLRRLLEEAVPLAGEEDGPAASSASSSLPSL